MRGSFQTERAAARNSEAKCGGGAICKQGKATAASGALLIWMHVSCRAATTKPLNFPGACRCLGDYLFILPAPCFTQIAHGDAMDYIHLVR